MAKKNNAKKTVLVTGGAGFIGSHLVDELVAQGNKVLIIDNLLSGKRENLNRKAKFYKLDVRQLNKIRPVFRGVDYVFHLAAYPRVQASIDNPIMAHEINLNGTHNVLIAAKEAKVKKVVFITSSAVYGDPEKIPVTEDSPARPANPYALHKYIGEHYCKIFRKIYGLPTVSLRCFNVYGKRQPLEGAYSLVFVLFLNQRLKGQPMTIAGDGEQRRDFVNVADVVRALIMAAKSRLVGDGEVINIGYGSNWSVNELAGLIGGPTINIPPKIEPRQTLADITLARRLLGWKPKIGLADWIKEYKKEIGLE